MRQRTPAPEVLAELNSHSPAKVLARSDSGHGVIQCPCGGLVEFSPGVPVQNSMSRHIMRSAWDNLDLKRINNAVELAFLPEGSVVINEAGHSLAGGYGHNYETDKAMFAAYGPFKLLL